MWNPTTRAVWKTLFRLSTAAVWLAFRLTFALSLHLGPPLFQRAAIATGRLLALADRRLDGRLTRVTAIVPLLAGLGWGVLGFCLPAALHLVWDTLPLYSFWLGAMGAGWGVACGRYVQHLPGWGMWAAEDGLQLGETIP